MTWETLAADVKATRKGLDEALAAQEAARLACDRADREVEAAKVRFAAAKGLMFEHAMRVAP